MQVCPNRRQHHGHRAIDENLVHQSKSIDLGLIKVILAPFSPFVSIFKQYLENNGPLPREKLDHLTSCGRT